MFAVCSSWFEIDEREWTSNHLGSHYDWELGAKTTTIPPSKVLDSEWNCFFSLQNFSSVTVFGCYPPVYPWHWCSFPFFVFVFGKPQIIHASYNVAVSLAWLCWTYLSLSIECPPPLDNFFSPPFPEYLTNYCFL